MNNLVHSGLGRSLRAVRDDEIAASLCGLRVGRVQTLAFVLSAACAGLGGGLLAVVLQLAAPGAFELSLSLSLLTAIVLGGLGSLVGAIWGAAVLVLLPNWTNDLAHSFSLSTKVSANLPLAIYGARADRRDARLAERDPGGAARAARRARRCGGRRKEADAAARPQGQDRVRRILTSS